MEITVYSHLPGMCEDGGLIFKPAFDRPVHDTIERALALFSHGQEVRILAAAISKNGEICTYNIRIRPHITLEEQYAFQYVKDFNGAKSFTYNLEGAMYELEMIFNDLSLYEQDTAKETHIFS